MRRSRRDRDTCRRVRQPEVAWQSLRPFCAPALAWIALMLVACASSPEDPIADLAERMPVPIAESLVPMLQELAPAEREDALVRLGSALGNRGFLELSGDLAAAFGLPGAFLDLESPERPVERISRIGVMLLSSGQQDAALLFWETALRDLRESGRTRNLSTSGLGTILTAAFDQGDAGLPVVREVAELAFVLGDPRDRALVLLDIIALYRVNGVPGSVEQLFVQASAAAAAIQRPLQRAEVFTRIGREYSLESDSERAETFSGRGRQIIELQSLTGLDPIDADALRALVVTELQQQQIGYVTRLIGRVGDAAVAAELYRVFGDYFLAQEQVESAATAYSIALATLGSAGPEAALVTAARILLSYRSAGRQDLPEEVAAVLGNGDSQVLHAVASGAAGPDLVAALLLQGDGAVMEAMLAAGPFPTTGVLGGLRSLAWAGSGSTPPDQAISAGMADAVAVAVAGEPAETRSAVATAMASAGMLDAAVGITVELPDAPSISSPAAALAAAQLASLPLDRDAERLVVTRLQELSPSP